MTVQKLFVKNVYVGNGSKTTWPITFEWKKSRPESIKVYVRINGILSETTNFALQLSEDTGNYEVLYPASGEALASGDKIVIARELTLEQVLNLVNQGPFFAEDIELTFDEVVMMIQQLNERLSRSLKVEIDISSDIDVDVDTSLPYAPGKSIRWNDDGTGFEVTEDPGKVIDGATALLEQTTEQANIAVASSTNAQNAANAAEAVAPEYAKTKEVLDNIVSYTNTATEQASIATAKADAANVSASNAAHSYANADAIATQLTEYLATKETITAPAVDKTLLIEGAAADSKVVGELKSDIDNLNSFVNEKTIQLELIDGAVLYETGVITDEYGSRFKRTDYINVRGVKRIENNVYGYGIVGTVIYDSNKTYLTGVKDGKDITTLPENAHYIIFTVGNNIFNQTVKLYFESELIDIINNHEERITSVEERLNKGKYVHFSVDDCTFWTDLIDNENTYESPFENAFLSEVKANHDKYGSTWSLFCFNQIGEYDISNVPSKFADYFKAESGWLKFQYHSENYDTLWTTDNVDGIKASYNKCMNALYRMTGTTDCIDCVTRLQSYKGSRNNMIAIRDCNCGIKGVLSPDGPNVYPYWDEPDGTIKDFMLNHDIYRDSSMQMVMVKSQKRIENSTFDITVFNTIEYANFKPMLELMTHYTSSEWSTTKNKLDTICQWLKENGYVYGFSKDVFKL